MISTCYTVNISSDIAATLTDFAIVDLAFLHCNTDGSLNYNNGSLQPGNDEDMLAGVQLLNQNETIVLYTIGGTGGNDFVNIGNNYSTFLSNLYGVLEAYGVNGIDLDFENAPTPQIQQTIQQLVTDVTQAGYIVTLVPNGNLSFWQAIVQNTIGPDSISPILLCNLQLYGGVTFQQAVQTFTGVVTDPQTFLGSGYLSGQLTPAQVTSQLQSLVNQYPLTAEAFIWRSPHVTGSNVTMADYAAAINGVSAQPQSAVAARIRQHRERFAGAAKFR